MEARALLDALHVAERLKSASGNASFIQNAISAMRQLCSATDSCRPPDV